MKILKSNFTKIADERSCVGSVRRVERDERDECKSMGADTELIQRLLDEVRSLKEENKHIKQQINPDGHSQHFGQVAGGNRYFG